MDSIDKSLIKLLAVIEAFKSEKFSFKPFFYGSSNAMNCFELLITTKDNKANHFSCTYFFECNTKKIYLEDYGTLYTSKRVLSNEVVSLFNESIEIVRKFLTNAPELQFNLLQTTCRIPEKFSFLTNAGFEKKEQLNHYENFKFVYTI